MATTPLPTGQLARMAIGEESAFKTPPAAFKSTYFYRDTLAQTTPRETDPLLGAGYNNDRDETPSAPALSEHGGEIDVPLCLNHFGYWLRLLFGAPTTTGAGADKTHLFASGAPVLPSYAIEAKKMATDFRQHVGCVGKSLSMSFEDKPGYHRARVAIGGAKENLLTTSAAGVLPAPLALLQVPASKGIVRVNSVAAGSILGGEITYSTGVSMERYVDDDDGFSAAVLLDRARATGALKLRYRDATFDNLAIANTDVALELEFAISATKTVLFAMPAVRLERRGAPIEGPGGIESNMGFAAGQTAGAPMLSVTLKNQIATY